MRLSPGLRLRSAACSTEVIVIGAPADADVDLTCGGAPMLEFEAATPAPDATPAAGFDTGTQLGKRYTAAALPNLELLVTKSGAGSLAVASTLLVVKDAKPLPSSD